ncbi:Rho guanine nucleotide exchange factor [Marasmius tenuissimus]|uniref:Rho guanine nucleotide exchange factor n=1 Tax=Marasmius tenuissimus TaxID=585030 RepID=A0ABR2ZEK9_9AGAR
MSAKASQAVEVRVTVLSKLEAVEKIQVGSRMLVLIGQSVRTGTPVQTSGNRTRTGSNHPNHRITSVSSFENPTSSWNSGLHPTSPATGYIVPDAGSSTSVERFDTPTSGVPYPPRSLAWDDGAPNTSQRKGRNCRYRMLHRGHPYTPVYDTHNDGDRNETYINSSVSKKRIHDQGSRSNAEIHLHLCGRGSHDWSTSSNLGSLSESRPLTSPYASNDIQRLSSQVPLLNRTPPQPFEKSHNQQVSSLPSGESKPLFTTHATPSQDILNPPPASPFEKLNTQQTSILRESAVTSPSVPHATQGSLQDTITPTPPFYGLDSLQQTKERDLGRTRSERYEILLLGCKLGFPLWRPSPRHTESGEYIPDIGDVGVYNHGLPLNTLFNITQSRDSLANRDGIPEGVDPPCELGKRAITIEKEYHPPHTTFIQPEGAILEQGVQINDEESSDCFTFQLSETGGALLMVPRGDTLHKLEKTAELKKRVQLYWRQWYKFAGDQVDLDDGQALYLVTGVERCSAWAMAVWDSTSSYAGGKLGSLQLTVDKSTGACSWAFPPARCSTRSSPIPPTNGRNDLRETIFIRGFWIDRSVGGVASWPDTPPSGHGNSNSDGDSNTRDRPENAPSPGSSSRPSASKDPSVSGGWSGTSGQQRSDAPTDETILEFDLDFPNSEDSEMIEHPCRVVNKFAFELIARTKPILLNAGCTAISHDEDWISIVNESDEELPRGVEIIRRMCLKFKFIIEGDTIHTVSLSDQDKELLEQRDASRQGRGSLISVLIAYAKNDNSTASLSTHALVSQEELKGLVARFEAIVADEEQRWKFLEKKGEQAQHWLDLLQLLADSPAISSQLRSTILTIMIHLSENSGCYPKCLVIQNVEKQGEHPVRGGGSGDIWKGTINHAGSVRAVCLKVVKVYLTSDVNRSLKEYLREAIVWKQLKHPNVLPFLGIYHLGDTRERICLVSPWMDRGNLVQYLKDTPRESVDHISLVFDVASGLSYLHIMNIVHADLKGVNILMTPSERACITDFGLSRISDTHALGFSLSSSYAKEAARWLSPELHTENAVATKASDIYAFACVCYEILTGHPPFYGYKNDLALSLQVLAGARPSRPDTLADSRDAIWNMMDACWQADPSARPSASTIVQEVAEMGPTPLQPAPAWDDSMATEIWSTSNDSELLDFLKRLEI